MNKIKFLRILLFAFLSFSIISCTTTEEHYYYITPGDGSQTSGTGDGSQTPGTGDGSQTPGTGDGSQTPGTGDGSQTPGTGDGSQTPGTGDGSQTPGTGDGSQTPGTGDGSQTPIPDKGYKKLIQMNIKYDNGDVEETRFSYDNNGMLQLIDYSYPAENYYEKFYLTLNNNIIYLSDSESENQEFYEISGSKVIRFLWNEKPIEFNYDNEGHLIATENLSNTHVSLYLNWTWKDGRLNILRELEDSYFQETNRTTKYIYSSVPERCNGYNPYIGMGIGELYEFSALPWLVGMDQQDLPQKMEEEEIHTSDYGDYMNASRSTKTTTFNYTFYPDGYLKTCTLNITEIYGSGTEHETKYEKVEIYEYFWE